MPTRASASIAALSSTVPPFWLCTKACGVGQAFGPAPREKQSLSCGITGGASRFFPAPKLLNKNWVEGTFMLIAGGLGILVVFCLLLSIVQAPREIGR
jgi:hypothetical protein